MIHYLSFHSLIYYNLWLQKWINNGYGLPSLFTYKLCHRFHTYFSFVFLYWFDIDWQSCILSCIWRVVRGNMASVHTRLLHLHYTSITDKKRQEMIEIIMKYDGGAVDVLFTDSCFFPMLSYARLLSRSCKQKL